MIFLFYLDIKKDMLFSIGKILSIAILLILKHSKFGIMWVTIMSIDWTRTSLKLMASWRRWIFAVCHWKEIVVCANAVKIWELMGPFSTAKLKRYGSHKSHETLECLFAFYLWIILNPPTFLSTNLPTYWMKKVLFIFPSHRVH